MGEDSSGNGATQTHAQQWADAFGHTAIVVADAGWNTSRATMMFAQGGTIGLPGIGLFTTGLEVVTTNNPSSSTIQSALP